MPELKVGYYKKVSKEETNRETTFIATLKGKNNLVMGQDKKLLILTVVQTIFVAFNFN